MFSFRNFLKSVAIFVVGVKVAKEIVGMELMAHEVL